MSEQKDEIFVVYAIAIYKSIKGLQSWIYTHNFYSPEKW